MTPRRTASLWMLLAALAAAAVIAVVVAGDARRERERVAPVWPARLRYVRVLEPYIAARGVRGSDLARFERARDVIGIRLAELGVTGASVSVVPETPAIEIGLRDPRDVERVRAAVAGLSTSEPMGSLDFRVEVLPSSPPRDGGRAREIPWAGASAAGGVAFPATADGFEAFKVHEVGRFAAARESGERYVPSDPRYVLAGRWRGEAAEPPTSPEHFAVLELPAEGAELLSGAALSDVRPARDAAGVEAVVFEIKPEYRGGFRAFSTRNLGLPIAVVVNGMVERTVVWSTPVERDVLVSMADGPDDGRTPAQRQRRWVASMGGRIPGTLPLRLREDLPVGDRR
ncbi:MAG: hypothetical protein JNM10_14905 [Planctomycetia bacterium]|nr:hypothetical protein [Planctomycetia bacterium]